MKNRKEMRILQLVLKKKWFDMILSGEKKEEYREIKPYWVKRLCNHYQDTKDEKCIGNDCSKCMESLKGAYSCYPFDRVRFSLGYTNKTMLIDVKSICYGQGKKEWGAPDEAVFVIKLGDIVEAKNIER